jgi:hypothetical protein
VARSKLLLHSQDSGSPKVGRGSVLLYQPCVVMLVLTQPDLLYKLFSNERLLVGGFLARTLAADSKMQIQDECGTARISIQKKTPEELERARRMQKCIPLTKTVRMEPRGCRGAEPKRLPVFSGHATE